MKYLCLFLFSTAALFAFQEASSTPVSDDTIVLRAGDFALTKAEYAQLAAGFDRGAGALATGPGPETGQSARDVARLLALVSEAQRREIDRQPSVQAQIRVRGYVLLANLLLQSLVEEARKDEAGTRELYNSEKHPYVEVRARQILVRYKGVKAAGANAKGLSRTEDEAKARVQALHEMLKKGGDSSAVAQSDSDDESTSSRGGDLGYFQKGRMTAEFETIAFKLPAGGVSEPFKTEYGYHIVQVLEHRALPFEKVRAALENLRARQRFDEIGRAGAQFNEAYFKP